MLSRKHIWISFPKIKIKIKKMRRILGRVAGLFSNRSMVGVDKAGNKYFTREEQIDGISKWVSIFSSLSLSLFLLLYVYWINVFYPPLWFPDYIYLLTLINLQFSLPKLTFTILFSPQTISSKNHTQNFVKFSIKVTRLN